MLDGQRHQLGKLRSFAAGSGADLGERLRGGLVGLGRFHRDSPLFPARSGALVVRPWCAHHGRTFVALERSRSIIGGLQAAGRHVRAGVGRWRLLYSSGYQSRQSSVISVRLMPRLAARAGTSMPCSVKV